MPSALLLSPDDQAVSAVTAVLEEMFVSCERPLDAVSASKKLNSDKFDLVLVDCENLPAAKLIFDVCRRGKDGHMPIPIAIVDGHAGLPTAFRLGADLVLTKPVARDQARTTIRTAVNRVKKQQPSGQSTPGVPAAETRLSFSHVDATPLDVTRAGAQHAEMQTADSNVSHDSGSMHGEDVHTNSDLITNHNYEQATPAPVEKPAAAMMTMAAAASAGGSAIGAAQATTSKSESAASSFTELISTMSASAVAPTISELEMGVAEGSAPGYDSEPTAAMEASNPSSSSISSANVPTAAASSASTEPAEDEGETSKDGKTPKWKPAPISRLVFAGSASEGKGKKKRDVLPMVAAVVVLCGGVCAAWLTQPAFRTAVQANVGKVLASFGVAKHQQAPAPISGKLAAGTGAIPAQSGTPKAGGSVQGGTPQSGAAQPVAPQPVVTNVRGAAAVPPVAAATAITPATTTPHATSNPSLPSAPASAPAVPSRAVQSTGRATPAANTHKRISTSDDLDADLTIERIDVVLPAKSAQERLISSVPPVYPASVQASATDNSVILKAAIDETGKVAAAQLVDGNSQLGRAAIVAVKHWRYQPYIQDGKAVPFQTIVLVDFPKH
ncbi:MAG: TonB family protein [Terriglobales bacterium]